MNRQIKWGILGYAGIAKSRVIPAMLRAEHATAYAIASRSDGKLKEAVERFGFIKTYHSYEALLQDPDIDAVYIPLPNALHKEWTIKAARAGKHILCEKPLALKEEDALKMIQTCKENGVKLMEAFMYRFSSRSRKIKELLDTGIIGDVKHIHSSHRFLLEDKNNVRVNAELGGGSLRDVGCYPVNMVGMVLNDYPEEICALKTVVQGVDFTLSAVLKYKNGIMASIHSGFDSRSAQITEIDGTKGSMIVKDSFIDQDEINTPIQVVLEDGSDTEYLLEPSRQYDAEVEELSMAILEKREPELNLEETLRNIRLIEELLEKAK